MAVKESLYNMKEIMRIDVNLDRIQDVEGENAAVTMILFHGSFSCAAGNGIILPGGVDLQIEKKGEPRSLSARYILEGKDREGETFHIFVENNGSYKTEPLVAHPTIYTDCKELQWLEKTPLFSTVEDAGEGKVLVRIYCEEE